MRSKWLFLRLQWFKSRPLEGAAFGRANADGSVRFGEEMLNMRDQARGKVVRAISNASFSIHGDRAYDRAIAAAAAWIRSKNAAVGPSAEKGEPFDVGGGGEHTARAIRTQLGEVRIWAATLDDPDASHLGRTWVTEITIVQRGSSAHFGARLFNVTRGAEEFFVPSLPGVVRDLVDNVPSRVDGRLLYSDAQPVSDATGVSHLIDLIERDDRRLPVVVLAEGRTRPEFADADAVARRLAGAAHVFRIADAATWELGRELGRQLSVFDGAARVYMGGLRRDDADPFDHPLWLTRAGAPTRDQRDVIVGWVLQAVSKRDEDYPRFAAVREIAVANELRSRRAAGDPDDFRPLYLKENERLEKELAELRAEHRQWLEFAEGEQAQASRRIQELQADVVRFRGRYEQVRAALSRGETTAPRERLQDLSSFGAWVHQNVGPNLWFAPKAIRAVEKNHQFGDPGLIGDAVHLLEDQYVAMKRQPGVARRNAYEERLAALGLEESPCFANRDDLKGYPEYSLVYRDEKHWCDRHVKHGGGADPRTMFRIYFCWDENEQIVLVGHLPNHLDNNMTN